MTTSTKRADSGVHGMTAREHFLAAYARECATTKRVLAAYPEDRRDLRPHERSKTARELAWLFVIEQGMLARALTTGFDWSSPPGSPPEPPATIAEIIDAFEAEHGRIAELVGRMSDEELSRTVQFPVGPKQLGDIPRLDFLWMMLHDQIHHRGQFSVYLRMAGGRVPSIYGPSADEPWF
ncbi:MAG TPA: DinB family protein [Longimicrobiales bacterium]